MTKNKSDIQNKIDSQTALHDLLSKTYFVHLLSHNFHWNVEGDNFVSLHSLFEEIYTETFEAIDEIAERIRIIGSYAQPNIPDVAKISAALLKNKDKNAVAKKMIEALIDANKQAVEAAVIAKDITDDEDDHVSEDLSIARISAHEKFVWKLNSLLK